MTFFYASRRNTHLAPFFAIRRYLAPPEYQKTGFFPKNLFLNLSWMKIENKIKLEIEKKFLEQNGTFGELCALLGRGRYLSEDCEEEGEKKEGKKERKKETQFAKSVILF